MTSVTGSIFMAFDQIDAATRSVGVTISEQTTGDGRRLDYAASRASWGSLGGREVYRLGIADPIGKVSACTLQDPLRCCFLTIEVTDANAWKMCQANVLHGLQARLYDLPGGTQKAGSYGASLGGLQLVDTPFESVMHLRKAAGDPVAALNAALQKAMAVGDISEATADIGKRLGNLEHEDARRRAHGHRSPEIEAVLKSAGATGPLGAVASYVLGLEDRLAKLEDGPAPARTVAGTLRAVSKAEDVNPGAAPATPS
jgi:hypothetical protein